jgi:hypothetical protein
MTTRTQEVFIKVTEEKFSFLLEKGFTGPVLREVWPETMIYYIGRNVAIECVLDEKDFFAGCYICKVVAGQPVQVHAKNELGVRVRFLLSAWVTEQTDIPDSFYKKVSRKMSREEEIPIYLDNNQRMLQEYGQIIIDDSPNIFP